jgi:hypothetical protein
MFPPHKSHKRPMQMSQHADQPSHENCSQHTTLCMSTCEKNTHHKHEPTQTPTNIACLSPAAAHGNGFAADKAAACKLTACQPHQYYCQLQLHYCWPTPQSGKKQLARRTAAAARPRGGYCHCCHCSAAWGLVTCQKADCGLLTYHQCWATGPDCAAHMQRPVLARLSPRHSYPCLPFPTTACRY